MKKTAYNIINGITLYRIVAGPLLILLALEGWMNIFRWRLAVSFFLTQLTGGLPGNLK